MAFLLAYHEFRRASAIQEHESPRSPATSSFPLEKPTRTDIFEAPRV